MARNRCTRRPRFDVIYNDAQCLDCEMVNGICIYQNTKHNWTDLLVVRKKVKRNEKNVSEWIFEMVA